MSNDAALKMWWSGLDPPEAARPHLTRVIRQVGSSAWRLGDRWIPFRLGMFLADRRAEMETAGEPAPSRRQEAQA